jgi:hypothetical protein
MQTLSCSRSPLCAQTPRHCPLWARVVRGTGQQAHLQSMTIRQQGHLLFLAPSPSSSCFAAFPCCCCTAGLHVCVSQKCQTCAAQPPWEWCHPTWVVVVNALAGVGPTNNSHGVLVVLAVDRGVNNPDMKTCVLHLHSMLHGAISPTTHALHPESGVARTPSRISSAELQPCVLLCGVFDDAVAVARAAPLCAFLCICGDVAGVG